MTAVNSESAPSFATEPVFSGPGPALLEALLAVQGELPTLPKDKINPHFGSRYTPLDTIVEQVGPILSRHRLIWTTLPSGTHEKPTLAYRLAHVATGEAITGEMPLLLGKDRDGNPRVDSQGMGSAITYARRYALSSVLNLVADEDDDANAASSSDRRQQSGAVNLSKQAKGLSDSAINAARQSVGLPRLPDEQVWRSILNIPEEKAADFEKALDAARAAS